MDRALKERIIGAAVLVLVVVLVVPVFLDGPPESNEMVSRPVPLPGQAEQQSQTVVLERDRDEPVPASAAVQDAPRPQPQPQQQASIAQAPVPAEVQESVQQSTVEAASAAAPNVSATGMWAVQLGSFGNKENAERLAAELRKQGFAAFLSNVTTAGGELHRVRVGPQKDRESAEQMAARLRKAGHDVKVLPHP